MAPLGGSSIPGCKPDAEGSFFWAAWGSSRSCYSRNTDKLPLLEEKEVQVKLPLPGGERGAGQAPSPWRGEGWGEGSRLLVRCLLPGDEGKHAVVRRGWLAGEAAFDRDIAKPGLVEQQQDLLGEIETLAQA